MDCKIFIEERSIEVITADEKQAEYHANSGECFVISLKMLKKGLGVIEHHAALLKNLGKE